MALTTKPKRSTHHRKRSGGHHRHSNSYLKTYWPYLPMLAIVGLGLVVNSLWSNQSVLGSASNFTNAALLQETNTQRAKDHEAGLGLNQKLNSAAQAKADDMVRRNYWSHDTPDGKAPWKFITSTGYSYQTAGENLAYGFNSATDVIAGWMNSPTHRANILNSDYRDVGFGVASSPNYQGHGPETIVVAEYAKPSAGGSASTLPANTVWPSQQVARIQLLTGGQAAWSGMLVSAIVGAAAATFVLRHGFRLKRALNRGEFFIVHHPMIDIAIVFALTAGIILTRTSGLIR